jgi:hypothetical protein
MLARAVDEGLITPLSEVATESHTASAAYIPFQIVEGKTSGTSNHKTEDTQC